MVSLSWSQVGTIVGALVVVMGAFAYHMDRRFDAVNKRFDDLRSETNKRFDDLRSEMKLGFDAIDKRFDDLKDWVRAEIRRIEERLERLEHPVPR